MISNDTPPATEHALIIGKFYPPHAGHHLLINSAARLARRVSVIVMAASVESMALERRVEWLRQAHAARSNVVVVGVIDDVPIDYHDALVWDQHIDLMRAALVKTAAPAVTAVFSSEPYGAELARRFDAQAVTLDLARTLVPVSGSKLRARPDEYWDYLAPATKAGLALRVVLIGSESSGTSTLSEALADTLRRRAGSYAATQIVPEYGRTYTVAKLATEVGRAALAQRAVPDMTDLRWSSDEFLHIAARQNQLEDDAAASGSAILVCDTDAFATAVWHERYVGFSSPQVEALARLDQRRLYLVTDIEGVPFVQDGLRDGEQIRGWMQQRFLLRLQQSGLPHYLLAGTPNERLAAALEHIGQAAARHFSFAKPLTEGH